jgi:hypothetical protein
MENITEELEEIDDTYRGVQATGILSADTKSLMSTTRNARKKRTDVDVDRVVNPASSHPAFGRLHCLLLPAQRKADIVSSTGQSEHSTPYFFYGTLRDPKAIQRILSLRSQPATRRALIRGFEKVRWGQQWTILPAVSKSQELVFANTSSLISSRPVLDKVPLAEDSKVEGILYSITGAEEHRKLDAWCGVVWQPINVEITVLPQGFKRGSKTVAGRALVFAGDTKGGLTDAMLKLQADGQGVKKLAARIQGMAETVRGQEDDSGVAYGSTQVRGKRPRRRTIGSDSERETDDVASIGAGKRSNAVYKGYTSLMPPVKLPSHLPAFRERPHTSGGMAVALPPSPAPRPHLRP